MYVLVQVYPLETINYGDDDDIGMEVVAVDWSERKLAHFREDYSKRYLAACKEFERWDDKGKEWNGEHEKMRDMLCDKYHVEGPLIAETKFKIVKSIERFPVL